MCLSCLLVPLFVDRCSYSKLAGYSSSVPEQTNDSPSAASIRKNKDSKSSYKANRVGVNTEEKEKLTRADSEASPVTEPTKDNVTNARVRLCKQLKRIPGAVFTFVKNASRELFLIPRIIMFMPVDQILFSAVTGFEMENYRHARDKMHSKSSLKLLFDEDDMEWIM